MRWEVLHGLRAVAALKRGHHRIEFRDYFIVLHGLRAVAALKPPDMSLYWWVMRSVLHGLRAVAALKRSSYRCPRDQPLTCSPRPSGCGRIEAVLWLRPIAWRSFGSPRPSGCGRIEARGPDCRAVIDSVVLHGLRAVAALKQRVGRGVDNRDLVLHGLRAVAALKRQRTANFNALANVLHGLRAVAALKRNVSITHWRPVMRSPRPSGCGRIEAWYFSSAVPASVVVLHGLRAVAALKLVEAVVNAPGVEVLHGLRAVAALKPCRLLATRIQDSVLHGLRAVAALKPSRHGE